MATEEGLLIKAANIFYNGNKIHYTRIFAVISSMVCGGICVKKAIQSLSQQEKMRFNKWYYGNFARTLKYINLLIRVHLPLSINSILIISHLKYLKKKGEKLVYNDIKSGYIYGLLNFILSAFIINKIIDYYLYKISIDSNDITIKIFEKFILSPAESQLISEMYQINCILHEKLGKGVDNIRDLENIIWEYLGPIDEAVDYKDFNDMINYVQILKNKFDSENRQFTLERYLIKRAMDMLDFRIVANYSIWKNVKNNTNRFLIVLLTINAQIIIYLIRLFTKITISQLWYITLLELSGNHKLLDQYLYSLMSREPLYLMIGFPFFILRFTPFKSKLTTFDKPTQFLKNWIIINVKEITNKLFGTKGL